ncbi:type I-B CRISPR-associated protein Cas8b1/Cst1 [Pelagibacteraceae bacterium]|nr:type I-B CRISPR-associated protein Cas8b1/Cst1 [Pelagibacteraceae bacterium]MDC3156266.1 type I-B CRISPR-associated protein Cas8b1/Cst1 [Pelagibacteraceae bacterium]
MEYNLNFHCRAVQIEVFTDLKIIKQCNRSTCIRKNAKMCMAPKEVINILKRNENLTSYKFNSMIAEHFVCKICGIYTHQHRRSDPNGAAINIRCIDSINPFKYEAEFIDMKNK